MAHEDGGDKKEATTTGHHEDLFHPVPRSLLLLRGVCSHLVVVASLQEEGVGVYFDGVTSVLLVRVVQDGTLVVVAVVDVVRNVHD